MPEARLNLVIYHMHNNEVQEAYEHLSKIRSDRKESKPEE